MRLMNDPVKMFAFFRRPHLVAGSAVLAISVFALQALARSGETSTCYLSREYRAEVRDRALVRIRDGQARIEFQMTYCDYTMSPECGNARSEDLEVRGRAIGDRIRAKSADGSCEINIRFLKGGARALVSQGSACSQVKYWGPHGVYMLEKLDAGEESACEQR